MNLLIKKIFFHLNKSYYSFKKLLKQNKKISPIYRVELIDTNNKKILIHHQGIEIPLKLHLTEAIYDLTVLLNLHPIDACLIGYYYGKHYCEFLNNNKKKSILSSHSNFLLKDNSNCKFKITSQNRDGKLEYLEIKTLKSFVSHPIQIVKNEFIISNFDQVQACYIGILAGLAVNKYGEENIINGFFKPTLQIIS